MIVANFVIVKFRCVVHRESKKRHAVFVLMYRSIFLHEHDSDNVVQFSRDYRHQHTYPRRSEKPGSKMAKTGKKNLLIFILSLSINFCGRQLLVI